MIGLHEGVLNSTQSLTKIPIWRPGEITFQKHYNIGLQP